MIWLSWQGAKLVRFRNWIVRPEVFVTVFALVPVVVALVRALHADVLPMGDFANIEIRSRDVFSIHHFPLLGSSSSASKIFGQEVNHPGPMLFYFVAPFVAIFGGTAGLPISMAVLNCCSIVGASIVGYRIHGRNGSHSATFVASILVWVLGSDLLTNAWNPYPLILLSFVMLLLAWGVMSGRLLMLPWLLLIGSFCVQTHLGYIFIVVGVCALTLFVLMYRGSTKELKISPRGDIKHGLIISAAVMLACWAPPILEQLFGEGNIGRLLSSASKDVTQIGSTLAVRMVAAVDALPPWWSRRALSDSIVNIQLKSDGGTIGKSGLPTTLISAISLSAIVALFAVLAIFMRRRKNELVMWACILSISLIPIAVFAVAKSSPTYFGAVAVTNMMWLWPIGGFIAFTIVLVLGSSSRFVRHNLKSRVGLVCLTILFSIAAIPTFHHQAHKSNAMIFGQQNPAMRAVTKQLDAFDPGGSVVVDTTNEPFNCPYYSAIMAYLQRRGIDFNVTESGSLAHRQMGPGRTVRGDEVATLHIFVGRSAIRRQGDADVVAFVNPLSETETTLLKKTEEQVVEIIQNQKVSLSALGLEAVRDGRLLLKNGTLTELMQNPRKFVRSGIAVRLFRMGALALEEDDWTQFEILSELSSEIKDIAITVSVTRN